MALHANSQITCAQTSRKTNMADVKNTFVLIYFYFNKSQKEETENKKIHNMRQER